MRVLIVDDDLDFIQLCQAILSGPDRPQEEVVIDSSQTLAGALEALSRRKVDVLLLDLRLPDSKGFDTFLKVQHHSPSVPVVMLTAMDDQELAYECVRQGAQDYILKKDFNSKAFQSAIRYAVERNRYVEELRKLALVDSLTGLYNRRGFVTIAEQFVKLASRSQKGFLLLFMDMDGLKAVNDKYGHQEGDRSIMRISEILKQTFRRSDIIARIGGDEFVVIAVDSPESAAPIIRKHIVANLKVLNAEVSLPKLSLSVGSAYFSPGSETTLDDLLGAADRSLYEEKKKRS